MFFLLALGLAAVMLVSGCASTGRAPEKQDLRPQEIIKLEQGIGELKARGMEWSEVQGYMDVAVYYWEQNDTANASHYANSGLELAEYLLSNSQE
jgi:hypothetical protein